ncbi:hypothetical protein HH682_15305 [Rosenbergiella sp. S61]|uniref:Biofilm development protein YmgB/AriR n=1 Tax=Rosenbergiella gaditana TaxID=2726987 RepID=A0ABS5T2K9_9GAMM|nr:hypothetical protein [Rosenbergiella gaditana]MBT0725745.1 hypothetical protein [Rosenbergiella gaditana]
MQSSRTANEQFTLDMMALILQEMGVISSGKIFKKAKSHFESEGNESSVQLLETLRETYLQIQNPKN